MANHKQKSKNNSHIMTKKLRERALIEDFLVKCPDYRKATFDSYSENPDLIYDINGQELGFDSVIISKDENAINCRFDQNKCQLSTPGGTEDFGEIVNDLIQMLFKHLREYSIPTVLVFSVFDERVDLKKLANSFRLPEFNQLNIKDYYITNKTNYIKVSENDLSNG